MEAITTHLSLVASENTATEIKNVFNAIKKINKEKDGGAFMESKKKLLMAMQSDLQN